MQTKSELNNLVKKAEEKELKAEQFVEFDVRREGILKQKHVPHQRHDFVQFDDLNDSNIHLLYDNWLLFI
jgi:hypothetical protein